MFGLSLSKLIVLVLVVGAVWYGFRWLKRLNRIDRDGERRRLQDAKGTPFAEEMIRCPACDSYVIAHGARRCGRRDCPYPH